MQKKILCSIALNIIQERASVNFFPIPMQNSLRKAVFLCSVQVQAPE